MKNVDPYRYQQQQDKKNKEAVSVAALVKVVAFNPDKMTVDVQPLSKRLDGGEYHTQPQILALPVAATKSGGFVFRPWIKAGDVGLVVYIDHDIDSVVASGQEAEPNTERNHSPSDAVFIGGIVTSNAPVSGIPADAASIATEDGSIYIAVTKGGIKIQGDVQITGQVTSTGDVQVSGQVSVTGDVVGGGISLDNHTHPYTWTDPGGSGNTSPPN